MRHEVWRTTARGGVGRHTQRREVVHHLRVDSLSGDWRAPQALLAREMYRAGGYKGIKVYCELNEKGPCMMSRLVQSA